jgi:hypothetical protein
MAQWDVTVANIVYIRLEADTEDEARQIALHRIRNNESHEQRVLQITQIKDE